MASARPLTVPATAPAAIQADTTCARLAQSLALLAISAMICLSVTMPIIEFNAFLPWVKVEQILLPVIFLIYTWLALTGIARPIRYNAMITAGIALSSCILLSLFYGAAVLHHEVIWRDFLELPKALLPAAYFTVAYEADLSERSLRKLLRFFSLAVLLVCLYAWAQWMGLGFTYTLNATYSRGVHDDALFGARRVYATFGNANVLGQFLTWTFAAFALAAMSRVGNRFWNSCLALASVITLAMTGSRYGLIDAGLCVILLAALPAGPPQARAKRLGALAALVPVFAITIWIVAVSNTHTFERYQELLSNPYQTRSLQGRLATLWPDAEEAFLQSPLFGHGPAKLVFLWAFTDSEYLVILKEFGLVGFFSYLVYYLYPLDKLWKGLRSGARGSPQFEAKLPTNYLVLRLSFIMVITGLAMNIGMSTYLNMLLQGFFWLWLGLGVRAAKTISQIEPPGFDAYRSR